MIRHLESALRKRARWIDEVERQGTTAYRLFGNKEGIDALTVDRYADVLIFTLFEGRGDLGESDLKKMAEWYLRSTKAESVYLKRFVPNRFNVVKAEDLISKSPLMGREMPGRVRVGESGIAFEIEPYGGFSTGLFLDQRDHRSFLRLWIRSQRRPSLRVLNCFSYTGAFSIACAMEGAKVTSVDVSPKVLEWSKVNWRLNRDDLQAHRFIARDVFSFFNQAERKNEQFDLIILDPPSFSRDRNGGHFSIRKDWGPLLDKAVSLLSESGSLFFSSNFERWESSVFKRAALEKVGGLFKENPLPCVPFDFSLGTNPIKAVFVTRS